MGEKISPDLRIVIPFQTHRTASTPFRIVAFFHELPHLGRALCRYPGSMVLRCLFKQLPCRIPHLVPGRGDRGSPLQQSEIMASHLRAHRRIRDRGLSPPCPSPNQRSWPLTSVPIAESEIIASHLRARRRIRDRGLSPPCPSPNQRSWPLTSVPVAESEIVASHLRARRRSWCLWSKPASTHRPRVWSRRGDRPVAPLSSVPSGSRKIEPLRFARPRNKVSSMHGGRQ